MAILFALRVFGRNHMIGNHWRNTFCILFWCLSWGSKPGFMSNKPRHYLRDRGVFDGQTLISIASIAHKTLLTSWRNVQNYYIIYRDCTNVDSNKSLSVEDIFTMENYEIKFHITIGEISCISVHKTLLTSWTNMHNYCIIYRDCTNGNSNKSLSVEDIFTVEIWRN